MRIPPSILNDFANPAADERQAPVSGQGIPVVFSPKFLLYGYTTRHEALTQMGSMVGDSEGRPAQQDDRPRFHHPTEESPR